MVKVHECCKCKYEWAQRGEHEPKCCPRCKRYDWKEESKMKNEAYA